MDVVYILGNGSKWNNNELRFSLRSVEKHFPHSRIFIVGECPSWLQNVIHIDARDTFAYSDGGKMKNAVRKIRAACKDERVSETFVLMNDDFFFLKECAQIEPYSLGTIQQMIDRHRTKTGYYFNALRGTKNFLSRQGIANPIFYGAHYPMLYEKSKFLKMTADIDWMNLAYSWRTIYGNLFEIGNIERADTKITSGEEFDDFLRREDSVDFLSTNDAVVLRRQFQDWLDARFPAQSKYERKYTDRHELSRKKVIPVS